MPTSVSQLTLLTDADPFSDLIASQLPRQIGGTSIGYRTLDRGALIDALVKGNFDAALIKVEATHHTPKFWTAFFTPGDPYVAFGTPIAALPAVDLTKPGGFREAGLLINNQGNWVGVARELGLYLASERLTGIRSTASGQFSFEEIGTAK
ncbi:MAG: hypothetical protein JO013_06725 [Alphaproteobacteria bacterium]|nr:hypothetical protein [Alphaproteobacteria bacterium]